MRRVHCELESSLACDYDTFMCITCQAQSLIEFMGPGNEHLKTAALINGATKLAFKALHD